METKVFNVPSTLVVEAKPPATIQQCFDLPKDQWRYVRVPDTDLYDSPHPGIAINGNKFGPGMHHLPGPIADEAERILRVFEKSNLRIMRPTADFKALRDIGARQSFVETPGSGIA